MDIETANETVAHRDTPEIEVGSGLCQPLRRRFRRFFTAKQLYECLRPVFHVTYIHGLTFFYISCDSKTGKRTIKKTIFGYINGIMHIVLFGFAYSLTIYNNCESVASYFFRSRITYFGDMMQIVSGFIGVTVIYLTAFIPNHRLERCLQKFHTMDMQLQTVGVKIMYSKVLRFSYMILISMFLVNVLFTCGTFSVLYSSRVSPTLALHFTFLIQHTVIAIAIALFTCFTYLVEMRLVMVNKKFHTMDMQLQTVGVKIMYSKVLRFSYMILISMFLVNILFTCGTFSVLYSSRVSPTLALHFTFLIQHTVIAIAIALFSCFTYLVEMRLVMINKRYEILILPSEFHGHNGCIEHSYAMWLFKRLVQKSGNRHHDVYTCYRFTLLMALWLGIVPYYVTTSSEGRGKLTESFFGYTNIILRMAIYFGNFIYSTINRASLMSNFFLTEISNTIDGMQKINGMLGIFIILLISLLNRRKLLEVLAIFDGLETEAFPRVGVTLHQVPAARKMRRLIMILVGTMSTIFGFAMFKRQRLVGIIQNNIVVDELFVRLGMKLDYRRILLSSFLISLGMLLFNVIYLCVSYSLLVSATISPSFVTFTAFALPHINICLVVFKFLCTTDLARSRFSMLNEILQDILDAHIEQHNALELSPMHSVVNHRRYSHRLRNLISTPMKRYSVTSVIRLNPEYAIKQVSNIHNLLCDICQTIEEYFTYPLLGIIAISFLFILFDDFYILEAILNPKRLDVFEADEFFAFFLMQLIWYIVIIVLIVEASSRTILHSSYTAAIVHKILNITDDPELRDRLFRLSLQLSHRKVLFTAAGLFRLDRTLIFTITGAATCYLIILIQFRFTHHMDESGSNSTNNSHSIHLGD
uniref:Uncharacterized protein LOC108048233 n=1 Tax=Drosophila rhopaloa TaxID=1041015 RepID=A0A6P4F1F7_DRORH